MQPTQSSAVFLPGAVPASSASPASGPSGLSGDFSASRKAGPDSPAFSLELASQQSATNPTDANRPSTLTWQDPPAETPSSAQPAASQTSAVPAQETTGDSDIVLADGAPGATPVTLLTDQSVERPDPASADPLARLTALSTPPQAINGPQASPNSGPLTPATQTPVTQASATPTPATPASATPASADAPPQTQIGDPGNPAPSGAKTVPQTQIADPGNPAQSAAKTVPQTQISESATPQAPSPKPVPTLQVSDGAPAPQAGQTPTNAAAPVLAALKSAETAASQPIQPSIAAGQSRPEARPGATTPTSKINTAKSATATSGSAASAAAASTSAASAPQTSAASGEPALPSSDASQIATKAQQAATAHLASGGDTAQARPALPESSFQLRSDAALQLQRPEMQAGLERAAQSTPRFTPQSASQLAAQITRRFNAGNRVFDIRLDPAELGRVDVRLELAPDQRVQAILTAERMDTLAELQRSARELARALNEAGLDLAEDGLSFQLSEDSEQAGFADEDAEGVMNVYAEGDDILLDPRNDTDRPVTAYGFLLAGRDRVNVMA